MSRASAKMTEIGATLSAAAARWQKRHGGELPRGACQLEPIDRKTPFDELAEKEEKAKTPFDELAELGNNFDSESENAMRIYLEANAQLLDFLFADGPHPACVMRRLYAWVKKFRPDAIWDMGYRSLGVLLNESHAAMEWRIGVLLDDYATARGVNGVKAPWQRTAEACAEYSAAQRGNANRLGGKKSAKAKAKSGKKGK